MKGILALRPFYEQLEQINCGDKTGLDLRFNNMNNLKKESPGERAHCAIQREPSVKLLRFTMIQTTKVNYAVVEFF